MLSLFVVLVVVKDDLVEEVTESGVRIVTSSITSNTRVNVLRS